jgi:hypothetical protein
LTAARISVKMVSKGKHITDHAFRESLKQYQQAPPEGIWNGIRDTLERDRRRTMMTWAGRVAASAALILAAGSVWFLMHRTPEREVVKSEDRETAAGKQDLTGVEPGAWRETEPESPPGPGTGAGPDLGPRAAMEPGSGPGYSPESVPAAEKIAASDVSATARETGMTGSSGRGTPLQRVSGRYLDHLGTEARATAYTLAVHSQPEAAPQVNEGIDVFEEFGEDGHSGYNKWAVGGQVSPLYSYRNLDAAGEATSSTVAYNDLESGVVSYAGGVNLNYFPAKRLSIQSGVYYSRMGISISNAYLASTSGRTYNSAFPPALLAVSNSSGQIELGTDKANTIIASIGAKEDFTDASNTISGGDWAGQDIRTGDLRQHFEYLEVPVILRYRLVDRRIGLNLLGGLSTNFLVGNKVYFEEGGNREYIGTTDDIKMVNYSSVVGLGLQYSIKRNFAINLEPTFRYYLNSINTGSGIGAHPYSLGFFTGISYAF